MRTRRTGLPLCPARSARGSELPHLGLVRRAGALRVRAELRTRGGVRRFLVGTPPVLSLLALESALDLVLEAGLERVRRKSVALTRYVTYLFDTVLARSASHWIARLPSGGVARERSAPGRLPHRGSLIEELGVLPDFREPDSIRLGLAPLTTSFAEAWEPSIGCGAWWRSGATSATRGSGWW